MTAKMGLSLAPGPRGIWPFGIALEEDRDPLGFLVRAQRRYGDIVHYRHGKQPFYLLNKPEYVKHVLVDRASNYPKPQGPPSLLTGNGLFKSEGELWKKQRAAIQPAFHRERLTGLVDTLVRGTREMLDRWEERARTGQPFDVGEEHARLTFSLMGRLVFTDEPGDAAYAAVRRAVHLIGHPEPFFKQLFLPLLPFLSSRREQMVGAVKELDALVYGHIARRRQEGVTRGDMLDMLMGLRDRDTGAPLEDRQVRDEATNLFAAGYEATAAGLTWTWYLLHQHPEVERKLREEVASVLGDRLPTAEDLPRLRYTLMVFEEAMRLYPPAWVLDRQAREADRIGGYDIPAGTILLMLPFLLHRHPDLWEDAEAFRPERFDPERPRPGRFAYLPFGAGQRICIGNNLALMKAPLILAMQVQRFRLTVVRQAPLAFHAAVTLTLEGGLPVVVSPVQGGARAEARNAG
jgi:cytochrome P450